jgi:hypothetical protein
MTMRCQRQVFVDDGWPYGCCALEAGHVDRCELLTDKRFQAQIFVEVMRARMFDKPWRPSDPSA